MKTKGNSFPFRIVGIYIIVGLLYISFSDALLEHTFNDTALLTQIQTYKGFGFIFLTAFLLFTLIKRHITQISKGYQGIIDKDKHYRALIENNNDVILVIDANNKILFASNNLTKELGFTKEEINGKELAEIIHPDDLSDVTRELAAVYLCPQKMFSVEFRFKEKNGGWIWLETNMTNHLKDNTVNGIILNTRNITERKQNREALKKSEEKYLSLFNYSPLPMWIFDESNLQFLLANDAACKLYGYTRAEYLTMSLNDIRPVEDIALMHEIVSKSKKQLHNELNELIRHKKKNGQIITVKIVNSFIKFDGKDARLAMALDVTAEQKALAKLEESNSRLKAASEIANLGYWSRDLSTQHVEWSEELYNIFEVAGNYPLTDGNISKLYHTENKPEFDLNVEQFFRNGILKEFEHRVITGKGKEKWILERLQLILDDQGTPTHLAGIVLDINDRKLAAEAIALSNERFEMVMEASLEAIVDWDIANDVVLWGNGLKKQFGYELIQRDAGFWASLIHPDDRDRVVNGIRESIRDKANTLYYSEYRFIKKDGTYAFIQHRSIFVRDNNGRAIRAVGALIDVTESMERIRSIERQNEALREIAWIQSHVVRAPLATLMGLTHLLKIREEMGLDEKELIDNILLYSDKLDEVIHAIVDKASSIPIQ
jgi:PAS domain S-box-containing protein